MSYRIEKNEALAAALGRIAVEEIALAMKELHGADRATAMHNTRKALKRLRSLLRSLRVAFPRNLFRAENRRLAEAGRKISPLRDVHVQLQTLDKLKRASGPTAEKARKDLRRLEQDYRRKIPALRRAVREMLSASRKSAASWPLKRATPARLAEGLKRIYKHGRRAFKAARRKPTPERLHEWRKQTKILGHGLRLIEALGSKKTSQMVQRADKLSEALGDDQDLHLVLHALRKEDAAHPAPDFHHLSKRITAKRNRLQKHAFRLGKNIFDEKPGTLERHLEAWLRPKTA